MSSLSAGLDPVVAGSASFEWFRLRHVLQQLHYLGFGPRTSLVSGRIRCDILHGYRAQLRMDVGRRGDRGLELTIGDLGGRVTACRNRKNDVERQHAG
jgi:hypothetical protein